MIEAIRVAGVIDAWQKLDRLHRDATRVQMPDLGVALDELVNAYRAQFGHRSIGEQDAERQHSHESFPPVVDGVVTIPWYLDDEAATRIRQHYGAQQLAGTVEVVREGPR